ncbi:hypothetical protein CERSUDRAFT_115983, partial [Gelatoporia subvermispora B]
MFLLGLAIASILSIMGLLTPLSLTLMPISWVQTLTATSPAFHGMANTIAEEIIQTRRGIGFFIAGVPTYIVTPPEPTATSSTSQTCGLQGSPLATYPRSGEQAYQLCQSTPPQAYLDLFDATSTFLSHLVDTALTAETRKSLYEYLAPIFETLRPWASRLDAFLPDIRVAISGVPIPGLMVFSLRSAVAILVLVHLVYRIFGVWSTSRNQVNGEELVYRSGDLRITALHPGELTNNPRDSTLFFNTSNSRVKVEHINLPAMLSSQGLSSLSEASATVASQINLLTYPVQPQSASDHTSNLNDIEGGAEQDVSAPSQSATEDATGGAIHGGHHSTTSVDNQLCPYDVSSNVSPDVSSNDGYEKTGAPSDAHEPDTDTAGDGEIVDNTQREERTDDEWESLLDAKLKEVFGVYAGSEDEEHSFDVLFRQYEHAPTALEILRKASLKSSLDDLERDLLEDEWDRRSELARRRALQTASGGMNSAQMDDSSATTSSEPATPIEGQPAESSKPQAESEPAPPQTREEDSQCSNTGEKSKDAPRSKPEIDPVSSRKNGGAWASRWAPPDEAEGAEPSGTPSRERAYHGKNGQNKRKPFTRN